VNFGPLDGISRLLQPTFAGRIEVNLYNSCRAVSLASWKDLAEFYTHFAFHISGKGVKSTISALSSTLSSTFCRVEAKMEAEAEEEEEEKEEEEEEEEEEGDEEEEEEEKEMREKEEEQKLRDDAIKATTTFCCSFAAPE
jgi:hypothetical protein